MRKLVAYHLLSVDGVAEEPQEFFTHFDEVMLENLGRVIASQDAVLLGRVTFDQWADYWPESAIEPFASFINNVPKYVATNRPLDRDWGPSTPLGPDLADAVDKLKGRPGADIGLHGSIAVTEELLRCGVVDELRLVVAPVLQGRGRRLFDRGVCATMTLTRTVTSPSGCLLLDYRLSH